MLQSWLTSIAVNATGKSSCRKRSAVCAVRVFSPPALVSACCGSSEALQLSFCWTQSWKYQFHSRDLSHHELVHKPSNWDDDEEDGCACTSCLRFPHAILWCSRTLTIFTTNWFSWRCFTGRGCPSVCLIFQHSQIYLFTQRTWLVIFCMVTESFSHLSVPAFAVRPSCVRSGSLVVCNFHLIPNDLRNRRGRSSLHLCFLGQRCLFLNISNNGLASMPSTIVLKMIHVEFLVWCVRQDEAVRRLQWLENLSLSSFGTSFLVGLSTRQVFTTSAEYCACSASLGTPIALNVDLAVFVFLTSQLCLRFLPVVSFPMSLDLLIRALKFPSACYDRICFSSLVMLLFLLLVFFFEPFWSIFDVDGLGAELGRNCVVTSDTPVRCLAEFQQILRRLQINHKQEVMRILHVKVRLVLRVGTLIQWRNGWEVHCIPGSACSKTSWFFIESSFLENPTWYRNGACPFSILFLRTRRYTQILAIVTLWSSDEQRFFWTKTVVNLLIWLLTFHLWSFLLANIISFFLWLVNLPRIWYGVSPFIRFGFWWLTKPDVFCPW